MSIRTSTFAIAAIAAVAAATLAPTNAFARFSGGNAGRSFTPSGTAVGPASNIRGGIASPLPGAAGDHNISKVSAIPSLIGGHNNIPTKSKIPQIAGSSYTPPVPPLWGKRPIRLIASGGEVDGAYACMTRYYLPDGSILLKPCGRKWR